MAGFFFTASEKENMYPLTVIILLGATFHASAASMVPIIFIVAGKAWNKKSVLCIFRMHFNTDICKQVYRWDERCAVKYTVF